jgi:malonyl CoA-acyl carrier protein transacylase
VVPAKIRLFIVLSTVKFKRILMELPQIRNNNVESFLDRAEIVKETAGQIQKDFGMFGVEVTFSGEVENAYDELHRQLTIQISELVQRNYDKLLSVLYHVDITDREITQAEQDLPHYSHVEIIAHQVIARELKKVLWRHYFKSKK